MKDILKTPHRKRIIPMDQYKRDFFKKIALLCSQSLAFILMSSCEKNKNKNKTRSVNDNNDKNNENLDTSVSKATDEDSIEQNYEEISTELNKCFKEAKFELNKLAIIPESLTPEVKAYGPSYFSLIALVLKKHQGGKLKSIFLTDENGALLAQKSIDSSIDLKANQTLNVQFFDNLSIKEGTNLCWVFHHKGTYYRSDIFKLTFEKKFRDSKVLTSPTSGTPDFEVTPILSQDDIDDIDGNYWNVDYSTKFHTSAKLNGFVITDLFGTVIEEHGERFSKFSEHPIFIAYKKVGDTYVRTIVRH